VAARRRAARFRAAGPRLSTGDSRLSTGDYRLTTVDYVSIASGAAMLVWPSPYRAAPVFLGFIFLLDPINAHAGDESLIATCKPVTTIASSICSLRGSFAAGCGSSGTSGRGPSGSTRCPSSATSRFSRCPFSAISVSRRSRSNVSRCTCSCAACCGVPLRGRSACDVTSAVPERSSPSGLVCRRLSRKSALCVSFPIRRAASASSSRAAAAAKVLRGRRCRGRA